MDDKIRIYLYIIHDKLNVSINPFMPRGHYYFNSLTDSFSTEEVSGWYLLFHCFIEIPVFNANSVDTD